MQRFLRSVCMVFVGMLLAQSTHAQMYTSAFTYQGDLRSAGVPAEGLHDLRFRLFDAGASGAQVGPTVCLDNVTVTGGRFTVTLNFGDAVWNSSRRWLEIEVRADAGTDCADPSGFTALTPRQELTAAPHATYALWSAWAAFATGATSANTAGNALAVGGQPASNVALLSGNQTYTGAVNFTNPANQFVGAFSGNGALLTSLNGANIQPGTVTRSRVAPDIESVLSQWTRVTEPDVVQPLDLVAWGSNSLGQLDIPPLPPGLHYTSISAAGGHGLALRSDGMVVAWGLNGNGQTNVPPLPPGVTYTGVAGGGQFSLAWRSDGTLVAWGNNLDGQCNVPPLPPGVTYTAAAGGSTHSLGLRSDGTAVGWGNNGSGRATVPDLPAGLTYTKISAGSQHSIALRSDGSAVAWGANSLGQLNVPALPQGLTYVSVGAGTSHSMALRSDGVVLAWGSNSFGQIDVPPLPQGLVYSAILVRESLSLALRSDGMLVAWGWNNSGILNVPPLPPGVVYTSMAAGSSFALGLRSTVTPGPLPYLQADQGLRIGGTAESPPAGGVSVQSSVMVDSAGANTGTLDHALRLGGSSSGVGIASKQTPGGNVGGLDFFTGGQSRVHISGAGNVGIGSASPATTGKLVVITDEPNFQGVNWSTAIRARHNGSSDAPNNPISVFAQQRTGSGFVPTGGAAVYGSSDTNLGVVGATSGFDPNFSVGVRGVSHSTVGPGRGVVGRSDGDAGTGVYGQATSTTGTTYGIRGLTASPNGFAVHGESSATTGDSIGVYGTTPSPTGRAVSGFASEGNGSAIGGHFESAGFSGIGVLGIASNTTMFSSAAGVEGRSSGTFGGIGVRGLATQTTLPNVGGLFSSSSTMGIGVLGRVTALSGTNYGVRGEVTSATGYAGYFQGGRNYFQGNVGIGTETPANPLTVIGNASVSGTLTAATFSGSGASLTALNAGNLADGTLPSARLSGTYSSAVTLPNASNAFAGAFTGNGSGLTDLSASSLASGTVPNARLAGNIARLDAANSLFSGRVTATGGADDFGSLAVERSTAVAGPAMRVRVDGATKLVVDANGGVTVGASNTGGNVPPTNGLRVAGNASIGGTLSKGGGSFKIDHPLDPENMYLYHSFVESPDMMNIYNGVAVTDARGYATIELPDYFEALNRDFRYQLTVLDDGENLPDFVMTRVVSKIKDRRFTIKSSLPGVEVSWQVTGIRRDAWANQNRIPNAVEKATEEKGKYLHPDAFNQPPHRGIHFSSEEPPLIRTAELRRP